jgi:NCAIR mutase (PurE)-related protein
MSNESSIRSLLIGVANGEQTVADAEAVLRNLPYEDIQFARLDHHRSIRCGCPEVIFCEGKSPDQVAEIASRLLVRDSRVLGTRANEAHYQATRRRIADIQFDAVSRCLWIDRDPQRARREGVVVVAAGTSDMPVAAEAIRTLEFLGERPRRIYDVGVAGLHRLLHELPTLHAANVVIVIAGMEGALPSVVAGLIRAPVIAVPTSVGYGASFGGLAPLLGMLNSCAAGIAVVNIDNGFGAAYMAAMINRRIVEASV